MLTGASACSTGATLLPPTVFEFEDEFEQDGIKMRCNTKLAESESLLQQEH